MSYFLFFVLLQFLFCFIITFFQNFFHSFLSYLSYSLFGFIIQFFTSCLLFFWSCLCNFSRFWRIDCFLFWSLLRNLSFTSSLTFLRIVLIMFLEVSQNFCLTSLTRILWHFLNFFLDSFKLILAFLFIVFEIDKLLSNIDVSFWFWLGFIFFI